jgi:small conductance mechanosensitive channel
MLAPHVPHVLAPALVSAGSALSAAIPKPTPTPSGFLNGIAAQASGTCLRDDVSVCGLVWKVSGHKELGLVFEVILGTPLRVVMIIAFGVLFRRILNRLIHRLSERIAAGPVIGGAARDRNSPGPPVGANPLLITRRQARSRTLETVLHSLTTALVGVVVGLMLLQELQFSTAPLLASASVFGVALGFGAQSLVRDIFSGMFMIIEDQYGVGDVIDVGEASGSVESVGLRITRLRDVNGTVWYVRNGEILRVGNKSQGWARAVLDVNVGYGEDVDQVERVLLGTAEELKADDRLGPYILEEPEVWGVEALTADGVVMRLVVKTLPLQQWTVARELRRRIKHNFDAQGIEMRPMGRTMIVDGDPPEDGEQPVRRRAEDPDTTGN